MKSDNLRSSNMASRERSRNIRSVIQTLMHSVFLPSSDIKKAGQERPAEASGKGRSRDALLGSPVMAAI